MTTTTTEALTAMLSHHAELQGEVDRRAGEVRSAAEAGRSHHAATAALVAYLADPVLPHAAAEERTIYRTAASLPEVAGSIPHMIEEHVELSAAVERLAKAQDAKIAASEATSIASFFARHVAAENDQVLPALAASSTVDLTQVLKEMHHAFEEEREGVTGGSGLGAPAGSGRTNSGQSGPGQSGSGQSGSGTASAGQPDTEAELLKVIFDAADDLAKSGQGDTACRLAARAWVALRGPRPDLGVKVTAALHRFARGVTSDPVAFVERKPAAAATTETPDLDVRSLAPAQRHETIFSTYAELPQGAGFVLVNDHDPKPLRYQFEAEHAGAFTWDVLEAGPTVWRVRIGRPGGGGAGARTSHGSEEPDLDVRTLPHFRRHDVIFTAYGALSPGAGFVLVNDHDPKPLRYQFEAQHAGDFTWDYLESGPTWRVRIGRPGSPPSANGQGSDSDAHDPDLDVRSLAPAQRHETIFSTYAELPQGAGFVLVNDHDPKPLRYQFEAEHAGAFTWDVLEAGPTVWRVRIGRPRAASTA